MNRGLASKPRFLNNLHGSEHLSKIYFRQFSVGCLRTFRNLLKQQ
jgi:hypothetical protein